jgi:protein-S-isoprenylcysteine O-methyltransferase Ste14
MRHLLHPGFGIFAAHAAFWGAFAVALLFSRASTRARSVSFEPATHASKEESAPNSRLLITFHAVGFGILYFGLSNAVLGGHSVALFRSQKLASIMVIGCGAILCSWALMYFRSWRFRATVSVGHELATGGPFHFVRHPIYMALALLALGSALWIPTPIVWGAFVLVAAGSDLRARSEEGLLLRAFGARYANYCERTRRFVPLLY